ncbi:hypothetical protein GGR55DRAFT_631319 [Xylaria sp. FL0064]|nr:hypothetical protein GGR55DRAFT_631319 [Xylaria sp. FL0064]
MILLLAFVGLFFFFSSLPLSAGQTDRFPLVVLPTTIFYEQHTVTSRSVLLYMAHILAAFLKLVRSKFNVNRPKRRRVGEGSFPYIETAL